MTAARAAQALPAFARSGPAAWLACRYADVQAVLADDRFGVAEAGAAGPVGTISWLRASVSRFSNGAAHQRRRALAVTELRRLDPAELRSAAERRARQRLSAVGRAGQRVDVMALLAREVPVATIASGLGLADDQEAAAAVISASAGYFPGADVRTRRRADAATARLVDLLGPGEPEVIVARIALLVQGCDATAGLIGAALQLVRDMPEAAAGRPADAILAEALRYRPPLAVIRRVARVPVEFRGFRVLAGHTVGCSIEAANRDPAAFEEPLGFDPGRPRQPSLTFGYGVRPCPGSAQALMLAAGVVDAVRERCDLAPAGPADYEPSAALRIPRRLEGVLR
jgi:cytochrome P450